MRLFHGPDGPFPKNRSKANKVGTFAGEVLEQRTLMTVSVSSIALTSDTGVSTSDKVTRTAAVTVSTSGSVPSGGWADVQFDHNGDGNVDGHSVVGSGTFIYDPVAADAALNNWEANLALKYRVVEHDSYGGVLSTSGWSTFNMTLDRVAPTTTEFSPLTVDEDSADSQISLGNVFGDGYTSDASLRYQVVSNSNTALFDSLSISSGMLILNYKANQHGTASIVVRCTDQAGNTRDSSLSVNVESVNDPPIISGFTVVHGFGDTWTLSGTVSDDDAIVGSIVYFGGVFESFDLWAVVNTNRTFSITANCPGLESGWATAVMYDAQDAESNEAEQLITV